MGRLSAASRRREAAVARIARPLASMCFVARAAIGQRSSHDDRRHLLGPVGAFPISRVIATRSPRHTVRYVPAPNDFHDGFLARVRSRRQMLGNRKVIDGLSDRVAAPARRGDGRDGCRIDAPPLDMSAFARRRRRYSRVGHSIRSRPPKPSPMFGYAPEAGAGPASHLSPRVLVALVLH